MGNNYGNINYNLSTLNNLNQDKEYYKNNNLTNKFYVYNKETFNIIKYIKNKITDENCSNLGMFRSVILKNNELKVFSPPKSINIYKFIKNNNFDDLIVDEFIEGTMINMFWNENKWEIATKSSVGGNVSFFKLDKTIFARKENTFRYMFEDIIKYYDKNLDISNFIDSNNKNLDNKEIKSCVFSFVMQHPSNRIVVPFDEPKIYLVAIYKIDNFSVTRINISNEFKNKLPDFIKYPKIYNNFNNMNELIHKFECCDYKTVGVMITNKNTFERTKIRNKNYENVKLLRGNQPKLQYRYLMLRQTKQIKEYLNYYPEQQHYFDKFKNQVHQFTKQLYDEYVNCFIARNVLFKECKYNLKLHISELHNIYKYYIKNSVDYRMRKITFNIVKDYVNNLPPAKVMYSINYDFYNNKNKQ